MSDDDDDETATFASFLPVIFRIVIRGYPASFPPAIPFLICMHGSGRAVRKKSVNLDHHSKEKHVGTFRGIKIQPASCLSSYVPFLAVSELVHRSTLPTSLGKQLVITGSRRKKTC